MRRSAVVALVAALAANGVRGAMELTEADFDEQVFKSGKRFSFVKFLAPWCGHCKKLKPDWDKLGELFNKADSKALIADVDCTDDKAKPLCEKYGVQGYPTIKYFSKETADDGEKYEDARDYNALKRFVKKMSKDPCVLETLANCNKKEKAFIEEAGAWDDAKVKTELETLKSEIESATKTHQDLADLFEKQKEEAMATMKKQEEAKKELDKTAKSTKFKIGLLEQKSGAKTEL